MKERHIVGIILVMAVVIFAVIFLFTRNISMPSNQAMPWQSYINDRGNTSVFNLEMNTSDLTDAMRLFGSEVEASLFESEGRNSELEVFFSSTKVGGISAKVVLNLILDQRHIDILKRNIEESVMLPSGVEKTNFNIAGESAMFDLKIKSLTFIPAADLPNDVIEDLFGKADRIDLKEPGVSYWYYPQKGLRIIVDDEHKDVLEFYNP